MYFKQLAVGGFDHNFSYVLGDDECAAWQNGTRKVFLIDPDNREMLMRLLEEDNLTVRGILLTHGHFDHCRLAAFFAEKFGVPVYLHFADKLVLRDELPNLQDLSGISALKIGELSIQVIHTPGHSPGAVCFLAEGKLLTGDTVFVGRCGRTDLEGSSREALNASIAKIKKLPDETEIYPGHDYGETPWSTVAREKAENPFFQ